MLHAIDPRVFVCLYLCLSVRVIYTAQTNGQTLIKTFYKSYAVYLRGTFSSHSRWRWFFILPSSWPFFVSCKIKRSKGCLELRKPLSGHSNRFPCLLQKLVWATRSLLKCPRMRYNNSACCLTAVGVPKQTNHARALMDIHILRLPFWLLHRMRF